MVESSDWLPHIDLNRCTGCTDCITTCPTHALGQVNGQAALVYPQQCTYCTACEDVCPVGAIELPFLIISAEHR